MFRFELTSKEVARVKAAAGYAGFPWQPIVTRPRAAREFCRRVEAEMRRGHLPTVASATRLATTH